MPGDEANCDRKDDWNGLALPAEEPAVAKPAVAKQSDDEDPANGGIRREPEIPEHEAIARETAPSIQPQEDTPPEEPDDKEAIRARALRSRVRSVARQAAMDPDDGIAL